MKVEPPVTILRPIILLTDQVRAELDRLASERHSSRDDLLVEVACRLAAEPDYLFATKTALGEIIRRRHAGQCEPWPRDPLDYAAVALCMASVLEQVAERKILAMAPEELDYWEDETKRTGLSFEELIFQGVFGPAEETD